MNRPPAPGILAATGIVVLLLGVIPNWWFSASKEREDWDTGKKRTSTIGLGLKAVSFTDGDESGEVSLSAMPRPDEDDSDEEKAAFKKVERYAFVGKLTWWLGVTTSLTLGIAGLLWLTRQRLPVSMGSIGAALAAATAVLAVITLASKPVFPGGDRELDFGMSLGGPFTLVGAALAVAGGVMIAKLEKTFTPLGGLAVPPGDPATYPPPPPPPPQQAVPACPRCSAPTAFVHEHQRWFCHSCRVYL